MSLSSMHYGTISIKYFAYWGESNFGVTENSLMSLGIRKKMSQIKKTPPPTRDFMNERSLKLTKICNLNF